LVCERRGVATVGTDASRTPDTNNSAEDRRSLVDAVTSTIPAVAGRFDGSGVVRTIRTSWGPSSASS